MQGQQAVSDQRDQVAQTVTSIYEQGDPQLLAFSSMLDAQSPADLTRRMEANNVIVGRETRAYDSLHAAEVLLQVREDEVQQARDEVEVQREAAARHLEVMRQLGFERCLPIAFVQARTRDAQLRLKSLPAFSRIHRPQRCKRSSKAYPFF